MRDTMHGSVSAALKDLVENLVNYQESRGAGRKQAEPVDESADDLIFKRPSLGGKSMKVKKHT